MVNNIFILSTSLFLYCIIHFVPNLPTPGRMHTYFVDTFLVFQKGVCPSRTIFLDYLLISICILCKPVWTVKSTFWTVQNHFPCGARIFGQLTFFLSTESTLLSSSEWVSVSVEHCFYNKIPGRLLLRETR